MYYPTYLLHDTYGEDLLRPVRRESRPRTRLEYQRLLLEYKKMSTAEIQRHFNASTLLERELEHRRRLHEAIGERPSLVLRVRRVLGRFLIATGERIRPEIIAPERALNG